MVVMVLTCIPSNLDMRNLVALHLQKSRLKKLWKGTKVLNYLSILDVSDSYFLTSTPDFSGVLNLQQLYLCDCKNLVEVHHSIRRLHKLHILDVSGCCKLFKAAGFQVSSSNLWNSFSSLLSWKVVSEMLSRKSLLKDIPVEIGSLLSLRTLSLSGNKFSSIPDSIKHLHRLELLVVDECCNLKSIPDLPNNIFGIGARDCQSLETLVHTSEKFKRPFIRISDDMKLIDNILTNKEQVYAFSRINIFVVDKKREIPCYLNYQGLGPFISFVAPHHPNRSIGCWIVGVSSPKSDTELFNYAIANVYNKTKNMMHIIFVSFLNSHTMPITYVEFSKYGIVLEGGDEIEIVFVGTSILNRWGLRLVYDEDEEVEMNGKQLVIEYSPLHRSLQ